MKKLLLCSVILCMAFAYDVEVNLTKGWNNVGFSEEYNITSINNENIEVIWYYNTVNKNWEFYSDKYDFLYYPEINHTIPANKAVWVYSDINQTVEVPLQLEVSNSSGSVETNTTNNNEYTEINTTSVNNYNNFEIINCSDYNSSNFCILEENDTYYFDFNNSLNDEKIKLDINGSVEDTSITPIDENRALFSIVTNNEYNESLYAGYFDNNQLNLQFVANSSNYYYNTKIDLLENGDYLLIFSNDENNIYLLFFDPSNDSFSKDILSDSYIESWYYTDNLTNLDIYNYAQNKTFIYDFSVKPYKEFTLNGDFDEYQSIDNYKIFVDEYDNYGKGDKILIIDNNGSLISKYQFDNIIRAVAVNYNYYDNDNNSTIYVFTHNDINQTMNVYSSDDYGKTWNKILSVPNFNYYISYVSSAYEDDNGSLHVMMYINNGNLQLETDDSFKTIKILNDRISSKKFSRKKVEYYQGVTIIRNR